jgi:hypothetical protein
MTKTELHELVEGLPENTLDGAAVLLRSLSDSWIDPDQTWFWTPDWLSGELEANREAKTAPGEVYKDADAFTAAVGGDPGKVHEPPSVGTPGSRPSPSWSKR